MQIDIKGRNVPVTDEIRVHAARRLNKVARQVSELARIEIEIFKEPNPRVSDCHVAEATLYLKGVTLRARDRSPEMLHSLNLMVDELARQVKRHRDKRRHRREARAAAADRRMAAEARRGDGLPVTQPIDPSGAGARRGRRAAAEAACLPACPPGG